MMKEGFEGFLMAESDGVVCFAACLRFNNHNPELGFAGFADSGTQPKNQKAEKESVLDCERKPRPFFLNASRVKALAFEQFEESDLGNCLVTFLDRA